MTGRSLAAWGLVAVGLAVVAVAAPAAAQGLDQGRRLFQEADFRGARAVLEGVLASSSAGPAELAEAHAMLSSLSHMVGQEAEAAAHADAALALEPDARPPDGTAEELVALFDEIRSRRGGEAASLLIEVHDGVAEGRRTRVALELRAAPEGLVAALSLRCSSGGEEAGEGEGPPPTLEVTALPRAAELQCTGRGESSGGAVLLESSVELSERAPDEPIDEPVLGEGSRPPGSGGPDEGGRPVSTWVWVAVGGAAALLVAAAVVLSVLLVPGEANIDEAVVRW